MLRLASPATLHTRAALGALVALGACSPPAAAPDAPPPADDAAVATDAAVASGLPTQGQLAVLSLNLHCLKTEGTAFATNAARFAAIAAAVAAEHVDVVLAQEVCVTGVDDARAQLRAALATATGTPWSSVDAFAHRAWEGTADEADEHLAIFARGELKDRRDTVHRDQGSLRRVTLGATLASRLTTAAGAAVAVRIYTVHLEYNVVAAREAQAREVASAAMLEADDHGVAIELGADGVALPVIVGGDFNARSADPAPQALRQFGFVEASGSAATTRIDHVFAHRSAPVVAAAATELFVGADAVSDHPGVLVRFVPAAPTPVQLTRIVAAGSWSPPLALRGDRGPLTWDRGWPALRPIGNQPGAAVVTSELPPGQFEYKFLRGDTDWELGANSVGVAGGIYVSMPTFP